MHDERARKYYEGSIISENERESQLLPSSKQLFSFLSTLLLFFSSLPSTIPWLLWWWWQQCWWWSCPVQTDTLFHSHNEWVYSFPSSPFHLGSLLTLITIAVCRVPSLLLSFTQLSPLQHHHHLPSYYLTINYEWIPTVDSPHFCDIKVKKGLHWLEQFLLIWGKIMTSSAPID